MHPDGLSLIGPLALEMLEANDWGRRVTAVGGLTLGADPDLVRDQLRECTPAAPQARHAIGDAPVRRSARSPSARRPRPTAPES